MPALKFLYQRLLAGESFGMIEQHRLGGTYFWEVLHANNKYIYWTHYGSSANKLGLNSLKWILSEIFKMTPEQFLYTYTTYSEWKRIDRYYKGDEKHETIY